MIEQQNKPKLIHSESLKPVKYGNSWFFRIRPSKIQENIIDKDKKYKVYAEEINNSSS